MSAAGKSHIGLRKENEDVFIIREENGIYLVADGMGGHEHGQQASKLAADIVVQELMGNNESAMTLTGMEFSFQKANEAVFALQQQLEATTMGTTLTTVMVQDDKAWIGHVGDSRIYLIRDGYLTQLTEDDSYYAELLRQGQSPETIGSNNRHVLLRAIGPEMNIRGQYRYQPLQPGDKLLLCTDGIHNILSDEELLHLCEKEIPVEETVVHILEAALKKEANDNLTVVLYRHESGVTDYE